MQGMFRDGGDSGRGRDAFVVARAAGCGGCGALFRCGLGADPLYG